MRNRVRAILDAMEKPASSKRALKQYKFQALWNRMLELNLSVSQLVVLSGVDKATISRHLNGHIPDTITKPVADICRALRIVAGKYVQGEVTVDKSASERQSWTIEEKAKMLAADDIIGDSFRGIVESLFKAHCSGDRG